MGKNLLEYLGVGLLTLTLFGCEASRENEHIANPQPTPMVRDINVQEVAKVHYSLNYREARQNLENVWKKYDGTNPEILVQGASRLASTLNDCARLNRGEDETLKVLANYRGHLKRVSKKVEGEDLERLQFYEGMAHKIVVERGYFQ